MLKTYYKTHFALIFQDNTIVHAEQTDRTIYLEPSEIESSQRIAIASDADLNGSGSIIEPEQQYDKSYPPRAIQVIEPEQQDNNGYPARVIEVLSAEESHDFTGESNA